MKTTSFFFFCKKNRFITLSFVLLSSVLYAQEKKQYNLFSPYKIGILFNNANEKNFLFNDEDYLYTTQTYKLQSFYKIGNFKKINFELIIEPQLQFLKHQLLNLWFIQATENNFKQKRKEFLQFKTMNLYGVEFGLSANTKILKNFYANTTIGLGFMFIDTRTERLAKGFTFIENGSIGFTYAFHKKTALYFGGNIGHVSNFNFLTPNSGYNVLGYEIAIQFNL